MTEHFIVFDTKLLPAEMKDVFSRFLQAHAKHLKIEECPIIHRKKGFYDQTYILPKARQRFERVSDHLVSFWFVEGDIKPEFTERKIDVSRLITKGILTSRIAKRMSRMAYPGTPFSNIHFPSQKEPQVFISLFELFQILIVEHFSGDLLDQW